VLRYVVWAMIVGFCSYNWVEQGQRRGTLDNLPGERYVSWLDCPLLRCEKLSRPRESILMGLRLTSCLYGKAKTAV
jgi:hypothetical protein